MALLGVGTTSDAANPLAVKAGNVLLAATSTPVGTGDLRMKLNKDATGNTLSQLYQSGYSGRAETGLIGNDRYAVKVSPDGAGWKVALDIDSATGVVTAPQGLLGDKPGFRNRLLNGGLAINQRGVSGTVTLAAGAYGHDRWKAGPGGCTYTFAVSGGDTILTITAGTLSQVVAGVPMLPEGGVFTLSWAGTAMARIFQGAASGSFASGPLRSAALAAATDTVVEFSTGVLSKVQMEQGAVATDFERRPAAIEMLLCPRYFVAKPTTFPAGVGAIAYATNGLCSNIQFPVEMRATPTVTIGTLRNAASGAIITVSGPNLEVSRYGIPQFQAGFSSPLTLGACYTFGFTADAEL
jgi:hypothetical protein